MKELLDLQKDGVMAGGAGGGNFNKLNKRIEELSTKLMEKTEHLSEAHLGKAEVSKAAMDDS